MKGLSDRQRIILEYMHTRFGEDRVMPSYREIGDGNGIRSTNGVSDHIKALIRKGYLERVGATGKSAQARSLVFTDRALELLDTAPIAAPSVDGEFSGEIIPIPVYGRVAAGLPVMQEEFQDDTLYVDSCMLPGGSGKIFALRVQGESMINDGILPGDYLFVRKQLQVRNGTIAVVMVDGESTVKRFYAEGDRVRLEPANPQMSSIYIHRRDFRDVDILGVVVGVYRKIDP